MSDYINVTSIPFLKTMAALMGAVFALILSGDIDNQGRFKFSIPVMFKLSISWTIGLFGGQFVIDMLDWHKLSWLSHGFIYLVCAVFGMLFFGIIYRAAQLLNGKSLVEIIKEIKAAVAAMLK